MKVTDINIDYILPQVEEMAQSFNDNYEPELNEKYCDIRIRLFNGNVSLHSGYPEYDTDNRGKWGSSTLWLNMTKNDCRIVAKELIDSITDNEF